MDAAAGQVQDEPPEIVEVASQPIHRVTDQGVAFPNEGKEEFELRSLNTRSVKHNHSSPSKSYFQIARFLRVAVDRCAINAALAGELRLYLAGPLFPKNT